MSYLKTHGYQILGIDKMPPKVEFDGTSFQPCNILDVNALTRIISDFRPETVVHLAARTDLDEKTELSGYAVNIEGTHNLVNAIREVGSVKRILYTSSQLVCKVGYIPKNDSDYCPNTLYGKSKVCGEKIIRELDGGGVEWCILRPTTIWGEGMSAHYQRFFRMIHLGQYFHIGKSPLYKSYGYVMNSVYQYRKFIDAPIEKIHRKTFYIADYEPLSLRKWADVLAEEMDAKRIKTCPESIARFVGGMGSIINSLGFSEFPFNTFRVNNILTQYTFDLSETEKVCGPLPFTFEEGVTRTVNWLKEEGIL